MKTTHNSSARIAWSGALIVLLLLLAYKVGREGLSNFYAQTAQLEIERWTRPDLRIKGDEVERVTRYLEESLAYSANNPWSLEELGTVQMASMRASLDPQAAVAAARSASANFRKSLVERPTSPFVWANLALSKLYLDEKDEALFHAIERAAELGPWEPGVQQTVILTGLAVWDRLNPARKAAVLRAMQNSARRDPLKTAEIARGFNRVDLFCALGYSGTQGGKICSQTNNSGSTPSGKQ